MSAAERLNGKHPRESAPAPKPSRAKRGPVELTPEALAAGLYAKRGELRALARRHGVTLDELARRSSDPESSRSIASLRRLAEARASVLLARARADATTVLLALAESAESDETRRRACVDLLKAPSHVFTPNVEEEISSERGTTEIEPGASASLLALLERLGEATRVRIEGEAHEG